ncbi:S-adenosyl-L-methionine-dependent methyltransferase [Aspergillus pseudodeflectus]|uniref:S-adenosyl-L-methionine-dependent methyltransferase n=1 Tax=Aspergillus pseudodeflectus TaxID=176178 RepID=A0ABR4K7L6_9EURO
MESKIAQASTAIEQLAALDISNQSTHPEIVRKCQAVISALQDPAAVVVDALASVTKHPCLVVLSNLGIFEKLAGTSESLTAAHLAQESGADRALVVRLLRLAAAWGVVAETGPETYAATGASRILAIPSAAAGLRVNQRTAELVNSLPKYLQETQYRNPASYTNGLFQYHYATDLGSFEYRAADEEWMRDFNLFMRVPNNAGASWPDTFDAHSRIFDAGVETNPAAPLVVDVAGGVGQDLRLLKSHLVPAGITLTKGQLVLEDQPHVIENVPADMHDEDFTYVKHNFFTPQPLKGARVYTLKSVLHDWADDKALEILRHIAASLTPGYSKLWVLDRVVPETGVDKSLAWLDISMMAIYGALERTEGQWRELLGRAGLRVVGVQATSDHFGLIEAELEGTQ